VSGGQIEARLTRGSGMHVRKYASERVRGGDGGSDDNGFVSHDDAKQLSPRPLPLPLPLPRPLSLRLRLRLLLHFLLWCLCCVVLLCVTLLKGPSPHGFTK
jgi:hypothetical protein